MLLHRLLLTALIATATLYVEYATTAAIVNHWERQRERRILEGRRNG